MGRSGRAQINRQGDRTTEVIIGSMGEELS